MTYGEQKAKYAYKLYKKGQPFKKVYAAVQKGDEFIVLHYINSSNEDKYRLAGGGVDEGEDNITAIKRELLEELNVNVEIVKSLGTIVYPTNRKYKHHLFEINCEAEIFLTKFVSYGSNNQMGIEGEFDRVQTNIAYISKQTMLNTVAEFTQFGLKL